MTYCDEYKDDPDEQIHSAKFGHVCDKQSHHRNDHRCACGEKWENQ